MPNFFKTLQEFMGESNLPELGGGFGSLPFGSGGIGSLGSAGGSSVFGGIGSLSSLTSGSENPFGDVKIADVPILGSFTSCEDGDFSCQIDVMCTFIVTSSHILISISMYTYMDRYPVRR